MSFYVGLNIAVVLACFICVMLSVINSASDKSFYLIFLSFNGFVYTLGHLLKILAPTAQAALVGIRVQYVGLPFIAPIFFLFACSILREKPLSVKVSNLIILPPILMVLGFQVFRAFELYINQVALVQHEGVIHWQLVMGPLQIADMIYSNIFLLLSLGLLIKYFIAFKSRRRLEQINILIVALLLPVMTNALIYLPFTRHLHDYSPLSIAVSLGLLLYLVRHYNLLKVVPLARTQMIDQMEDALIICDAKHHFLDANRAAKKLFPHIQNLQTGDPFFIEQDKRFIEEIQLTTDDGLRTYKVTQTDIRQGNKTSGLCIFLHDITDKQALVDKLYDKATFDGLMRVFNRASFYDRAQIALTNTNSEFALMMLDVDHFKEVNDRYGHSCGDMALQKLAEILNKTLRKNDLIGRVGGEEIAILMENVAASAALATAKRLVANIANMPLEHQGETFHMTVSIGISHAEKGQPHQLDTLMSQADEVLYTIKNSGRNSCRLYVRPQ